MISVPRGEIKKAVLALYEDNPNARYTPAQAGKLLPQYKYSSIWSVLQSMLHSGEMQREEAGNDYVYYRPRTGGRWLRDAERLSAAVLEPRLARDMQD